MRKVRAGRRARMARPRRAAREPELAAFDDRYYRAAIKEARRDPERGIVLLDEIGLSLESLVENGKLPHPLLVRYVIAALRRMREGEDPRKAWNIAKPAHRIGGRHTERQLMIAAAFELERRARVPLSKAKDRVGNLLGASARAVERAAKANHDIAHLSSPELRALLPENYPDKK